LDHYVQFTLQSTGYPIFNDAALACRQEFDCKAITWAPDVNKYYLRRGTTLQHIPGSGYISHLKDTSNFQCDPVIKTGTDCSDYVNINFDAACNDEANRVVANLGGYQSGIPAELRFKRAATYLGDELDFVIRNTSTYIPAEMEEQSNGCSGIIGKISFQRSQKTTFVFEIQNTVTHALVTLPRFKMSILDIDSTNQWWIERVRVNGFHSYYLEPDTYLDKNDISATEAKFWATTRDTWTGALNLDNPTDPWALTNHQKKKAVMFEFRSTSSATFEFHQGDTANVPTTGGGMFAIYGQTNMQASNPYILNTRTPKPCTPKPLTLALIVHRRFVTTRPPRHRRLPCRSLRRRHRHHHRHRLRRRVHHRVHHRVIHLLRHRLVRLQVHHRVPFHGTRLPLEH
jgi:hypothetical protein